MMVGLPLAKAVRCMRRGALYRVLFAPTDVKANTCFSAAANEPITALLLPPILRLLCKPSGRRIGRRCVWDDARGSVLVWTAAGMPLIFGFAGLGLDVSTWYMERRIMQTAVDAGAVAAAYVLASGGDQAALEQAFADSLSRSNFALDTSDDITVANPPLSGANAGNSQAVEIVLQRPAQLYFSSLLVGDNEVAIKTRAVGGVVSAGVHCVLALDQTMDAALEFTGTANANFNCGVASNSRSDRSILVSGNADLVADPAQAYGDILVQGSAALISNLPPQPYSPRVPDPYGPEGRNLQVPPVTGCIAAPSFDESPVTIDPGHYCGDFRIQNEHVTFNPGTYVIDGGDLTVQAHATLVGEGVTIVLTGADPSDTGVINFNSGADITLTAPSSGEFAGVVLFEDPEAPAYAGGHAITNSVLGGAETHIKGAIYTPSRALTYTGGAVAGSACVQLIARKVTFTGNAVIHNDQSACDDLGTEDIQQVRVRLVE